jgi:KDO2-lipid IV(A) lauroyltransferase
VEFAAMKPGGWYRLSIFQAARTLAQLLPRPLAQSLAAMIGRASFSLTPAAREALRANLTMVTGKQGRELDALCRANLANFIRMLADYFYCSGASPAAVRNLVAQSEGGGHLVEARERGKGTLLITAHLGNWEMGGMLLALDELPITVVTLDEPTEELTKWRAENRQRLGMKTIAVGSDKFAFVEMVHALRRNEFVAMLVDRPHAGSGTPVRFFGRETSFSTAPALLHQHTGATVLPVFVLRTEGGRYFSRACAPVEMKPGEDCIGENTQRIASVFEETIRQHPDQWFNFLPIWNDNHKNEIPTAQIPSA